MYPCTLSNENQHPSDASYANATCNAVSASPKQLFLSRASVSDPSDMATADAPEKPHQKLDILAMAAMQGRSDDGMNPNTEEARDDY